MALPATRLGGVTFALPLQDTRLVAVAESGESSPSSPSDSRASTPPGYHSPTGYQTSAPSTPDGSPKQRRKKFFPAKAAAAGGPKEAALRARMAEVSVEASQRGKAPWPPRQEAPSQRAVPPWAEPDAQPPPLPSAVYATIAAPPSRRAAAKPAGPTSSVTEPQPKPVHFNRPSPGASPIAPRKSLFGTNLSRRALSSESLARPLPWADQMRSRTDSPSRAPRKTPATAASPSEPYQGRRSESLGQLDQKASEASARGVGPKASEGRAAGPAPQPASEGAGGQGASVGQGAGQQGAPAQTPGGSARTTVVKQEASHFEQRTVTMVSVKSEAESKSVVTAGAAAAATGPGSPTPWRKARPAAEPAGQAAPARPQEQQQQKQQQQQQLQQQQQQPPWRTAKAEAASDREGPPSAAPKGAEPPQQAPWRRPSVQQDKEKEVSAVESAKSAAAAPQSLTRKEQAAGLPQQSQPAPTPAPPAAASRPPPPATAPVLDPAVPAAKSAAPSPSAAKSAGPSPSVAKSAGPSPSAAKSAGPSPSAAKSAGPSPSAAKSAGPSPSAAKSAAPSETSALVKSKSATSIPEATPSTSTSTANKLASPAPAVNKPASPVPAVNQKVSAPAVNKPASPVPAVNQNVSPAPAVNKPASPVPAVNQKVSPANHLASPAPGVSKPASPGPAVNQAVSAPANQLASLAPAANKPASPAVKEPAGPSSAPPTGAKSSSPQPGPSSSKASPSADSRAPASTQSEPVGSKAGAPPLPPPPAPIVLPELSSARSPTPPLPPKQTAAEIISAPALPQAPKPAVTSVTPPISAGAAAPAPLRPPSPSVLSASESSVVSTSTSTPPSAASEAKAPAPPTAPEAKSMSVVAPPPPATAPLIPAPPPEPERKVKTPEPPTAAVKPPDAAQDPPRPSRAPDTSVPPQPEFPPPPPLEKDDAPGEPALPPPPGFLQEDRIKPPTSILPCIQDEDEKGEEADDLPSPEYVRQSVSKRIMAFERHSSRDEESPPRERPPSSGPVRPVAPWVKRTSAGPVQQAGYWDMTSPEDQPEDAWPDPPRPPHEPEATKAQAKPVTSTKIPSAPSPPPAPAPSAPAAAPAAAPPSSGKVLQPQEVSPAAKVIVAPHARVTGPPPRPLVQRTRSTSLGDYRAHYITPDEPRRGARMPADGTQAVSPTPPSQPSTPSKEKEDPLFDPWCDPKNPKVINFQDVSAAAFKIKSGIMNTPCTRSHMSSITDIEIYFKKEFNQFTGSFKERGARYTLLMLNESQRKKGVIAASAGNHALALSYHGQDLGIPVTVVMPLVAPIMKVQACRQYGANIIVKGSDIGECREIALKMAKEQDLLYINGYDHPHILAGQGTMGLEIVEQVPNIDAVVIPVGGGGLIAGVALAVKALHPHVQVIGVEAERCASFSAALKAGHPVYVKAESTLADGLAVPKVGVNAYATAAPLVDKVVTVREEWIAISILRLVEHEKAVVEGAGATALAAVLAGELPELKGKRVVIPLCGGNIDTTILGRCLERGLAADGRLVKFTVTVSDRPGGIAELTRLLANLGVSIKDMLHERAWIKNDIFSVEVKVLCETRDKDHSEELRSALHQRYKILRFGSLAVTPADASQRN